MGFFLTDPQVECLPPAAIRLINLRAEPYPDGKRLRIVLELSPFQQKPHLALSLTDPTGEVVTTISIIEPVACNLDLTLHLRKPGAPVGGPYTLVAILSYPGLGEIDRRDLPVKIPSPPV
jgi:hypothetical protein